MQCKESDDENPTIKISERILAFVLSDQLLSVVRFIFLLPVLRKEGAA